MRHRISRLALALAFVGLACSDVPTTTSVRPFDGLKTYTVLEDFIQAAIDTYLPRGFESAVEARWASVKQRKNAGDMAGAVKQLNTLSLWIDKKTAEITIPAGETVTKEQAAAVIVVNMARWVYDGAAADPQIIPNGDVAIEIVPAGAPLSLVVPSAHAAVSWDAGSTAEERIIVVAEDPGSYPGICQGPLPTNRCQYPLFYKVDSYPHLRLINPGKVEVCLVTTGDRRPIEYQNEETDGPVHERVRLAHNRPANPADYTAGSTIDGDIEILPLAAPSEQTELTHCHEHSDAGLRGLEKAVHSVMHLAGRLIAPKNAYAYDQGPTHDFSFFSNFNAVDPTSAPDLSIENVVYNPGAASTSSPRSLSYQIANYSRRAEEGDATGAGVGVVARAYVSSDNTLDETDALLGSTNVGTLLPDGTPMPVTHSGFELPFEGPVYLIIDVAQTGGITEVSTANNTFVVDLNPSAFDGSDQSNTFNTGTTMSCGNGTTQSLYQSFTPSVSGLTGVDLQVRAGGGMGAGHSMVVYIRSGSPTGSIMAADTVAVPAMTTGQTAWIAFGFDFMVPTVAETVYFIEFVRPEPMRLSWFASGSDMYSRGTAYGCTGTAFADDFNFRTYGPPPIG